MTADRPGPSESTAAADPLGRAMLAHHRDEPGRLVYRDGADVRDGNVAEFYFSSPESWTPATIDGLERLAEREPVIDVGCGAGKHLLWWDERGVEAVGVDVSPTAVRAARERGAEGVLAGDMFDLPVATGAVGAVHAVGTQVGLGRSLAGIRDLLREFARVTDEAGVAVVDNYGPTRLNDDFLGYRSDPREGIAHRCFHLEFEREADGEQRREVGRTLQFLLCSPGRLREATVGTPWTPARVSRTDEGGHYRLELRKERTAAGSSE
ncbi:methyltransferase type 11 [Natrinema saccharevitans]|uniref:Methyltransferase type 11 n=1 Tax=Natrinema saccharevitans TaxID=301967 RepID=A0A1S8B0F9_9EURY|nr:class I SAM-dependent methyltransferase [Natrinema saccharevitans]OLZ42347.1 methyltransferase type 11 [Natrinema saccharevitans]